MKARGALVYGSLSALALLLACAHPDELAKLDSKRGDVERDTAGKQGAWGTATVGASFVVGDGVRTAAAATAHLVLSDGSGLQLQEKSVLRFLASPPGKKAQGLELVTGEVELQVGPQPLELATPNGPALLEPGTRLRLDKTAQGTQISVEIGIAHLTLAQRDVKAGESVEIGIGQAVIQTGASASGEPGAPKRPAEADAQAAAPDQSAAPLDSAAPVASASPAGSAAAGDEKLPRGPDLADLWIGAGDSLVIHDPHPPTVVGFPRTRCAGMTVLEVGTRKREVVGEARVASTFPAGAQRYRLRCAGETASFAQGMVTVIADSGSRRLAMAAPANRIDTDGRRYTILYQNLLPRVSVRWPSAPPAETAFTLFLASPGKGLRQFKAASPSYALTPGALAEGSHELWFAAGAGQSRKTTVVVQFDNAAPTASISSPAERGFAPGSTVTVSGMAQPGWTVSVSGRELPQDGQLRFSGEAVAPGDSTALAVRFAHPQRGVHYYLRRPSR